jgi:hypothetical protein
LSNNLTRTVIALTFTLVAAVPALPDDDGNGNGHNGNDRHVLLISIDGMHALDFQNCAAANTCPTLKALGATGVTYTRTTTSRPSDSFPGTLALMTGGTPKTVGGWYDVAYDRVLAPPTITTGNGLSGGTCTVNQPNGTRTEYEEGVDLDQTKITGGSPLYTNPIDGGYLSIDPNKLIRDPYNACKPLYPWNFIRTNTIYGVLHKAGQYTAWADKHAAYSVVSGPTGTNTPSNIDDYYAPDINSNIVPLAGITTATGVNCAAVPNSGDWTTGFDAVKCNDQLKVNAVLNWINGKTHLGTGNAPVPAVFGMNFQAVSVGQKLLTPAAKGGYTDAAGTPTPSMLAEIEYVDAAIGQMVAALSKAGHLNSTTIIITAKHGQSPIDTNRFFPIPGPSGTNGTPPSGLLGSLYLPDSEINQIGPTEDDISLLWLKPGADTVAAVNLIESGAAAAGVGEIFYGPSIAVTYDTPGLPPNDPRTPDIIVQPNVGVVYTGSSKKQSEHGGFAQDDTNVMLLVSNPKIKAATNSTFVETRQVAPTILSILGLDPGSLTAVQAEGTPVLPGLDFDQH